MSEITRNGCESSEFIEKTNQNLMEKPSTEFIGNGYELQKSEHVLMEKSMSEMTGYGCESSEFIDEKTAIANQILGNEYITSDVSIENIEDSFEFMDFIDEEKMAAELFFSAQKSSFSNSFDEGADQNMPKKAKYEGSENGYDKPEINFTNLVVLAVKNSPSGAVIVKDVYKFVQDNFPFYQDDVRKKDDLWKRSLRHALWDKSKKNQFFQHVLEKNATPSRINFCYTINPQFYPKFINSAQKECLKNQDQIKRTMKRPELFENFVF